jgi:hypothetical protein
LDSAAFAGKDGGVNSPVVMCDMGKARGFTQSSLVNATVGMLWALARLAPLVMMLDMRVHLVLLS